MVNAGMMESANKTKCMIILVILLSLNPPLVINSFHWQIALDDYR